MKTTTKIIIVCLSIVLIGISAITLPVAEAKYIVKGDTTQNVKLVQTRLNTLGYYKFKIDGIWGWRTTKAVKEFQKDYGLTVDGIVGARTEKALKITLKSNTGSTNSSNNLTSSELNLLARTVYAEARGEPYAGQVAVAAVVLNRVKSSKFPNTISSVVYQKGAFTAVDDGQINLTPNSTAYKAANDALNGWDPTNGCLFYYNPATATSKWIWSLKVELTIGKHSFARG